MWGASSLLLFLLMCKAKKAAKAAKGMGNGAEKQKEEIIRAELAAVTLLLATGKHFSKGVDSVGAPPTHMEKVR